MLVFSLLLEFSGDVGAKHNSRNVLLDDFAVFSAHWLGRFRPCRDPRNEL